MLKYSINTFGTFTVNYFARNMNKVLLGWRWGSQELGNYDRAYSLFAMPVNQMTIPLTGVALATLSRLRNDPKKYRDYYLKSVSMLSLIGMLVSAVMTVTGRDIILFLLGSQWGKSGQIFSALGPSIGINLIYATHGWLHLSQGNAHRWLKWGIGSFVFTAFSIMIGLPFGAVGVAIAYSLSFYILAGPGLWYAAKPMGIHLRQIWHVVWRSFVAFLLSGIVTWWIFNKAKLVHEYMLGLNALERTIAIGVANTLMYFLAIISLYGNAKPILEMIKTMKLMLPGVPEKIPPKEEFGQDQM
jgi:PST family polysaccharide transporter